MDWRALNTEELENQFNPQRSVADFQSAQIERTEISRRARRERKAVLDVPYGDGPLHRLDIFPAAVAEAPVHLFLHGGYWRAQDKKNFAFVAELMVPCEVCTVIVNYDLCPAATLDGVVESALAGIAWSYHNIQDYGGDPQRLTLSGNSAGAHLIAMALATDWSRFDMPARCIRGAVAISGIYDPAPAQHISVNAELNLTAEVIARNDALTLPPRQFGPIELFVGGDEPAHWIAQTESYAAHLRRFGFTPSVTIVPGEHHFTIMNGYLDPQSRLASSVVRIALGTELN